MFLTRVLRTSSSSIVCKKVFIVILKQFNKSKNRTNTNDYEISRGPTKILFAITIFIDLQVQKSDLPRVLNT